MHTPPRQQQDSKGRRDAGRKGVAFVSFFRDTSATRLRHELTGGHPAKRKKAQFTRVSRGLPPQVFNGECESLGDGRGLYHRTARASTKIALRHLVDPRPCYSLELYRTLAADGGETSAHMLISSAEAEGLRAAILGSMSVVCFGIPMLIPRDTTAYRAENSRRIAAA